MSELIYIDTNVYLDFFKNRTDYLRPLGEFANQLFQNSRQCKYNILISPFVAKELQNKCNKKELNIFLNEFKKIGKLKLVRYSNEDINKAQKYQHWQDRLHEILAKKGNAKYLVTRNLKDFKGDLIQIKLPENL